MSIELGFARKRNYKLMGAEKELFDFIHEP